ncbi:MAG: ATP-binding protein [Ruminococcus sp.]|nr:ATP-binding protein [Ruminococcus sp.]
MNDKITQLCRRCNTTTVFCNLGADRVIVNLMCLLSDHDEICDFIRDYSDVASALYKTNINLSEYILKAVLEDDNFYIRGIAQGKVFDSYIVEAVENELKIFQELSRFTPEDVTADIDYDGFLPKWRTSEIDFVAEYNKRLENIGKFGYGKYSQNRMFILRNGETVPVKYPDTQRLEHLYGYNRERQAVIDNTLALLDGKSAQNALLYGDAGTGKSSTIKAIVNEYADRGLRLIEITKEQLRDIPQIIDEISHNPLKFIIFIDDLTFTSGEDGFGSLKAMLEGSSSARSDNTVIYATSNRRHLVKETFSERDGDDVHRNDTMQELISLSARFGLRVNFSRPDKKEFVRIAGEIAVQNGIEITDGKDFELRAERFVMSSGNGRSPRTARQFVNQLINEMTMEVKI